MPRCWKLGCGTGATHHLACVPVDYTADTYIDVLNTYSGHIAWEQSKRDKLYAEVRRLIGQRANGRIRKHYLSILHVCRRRS